MNKNKTNSIYSLMNKKLPNVEKVHSFLHVVSECCFELDNLEITEKWGVRRCKKCGKLLDTSGH